VRDSAAVILGVNAPPAGWHDPAACLVAHDGTLLAFCEEERLSRAKHAERSGPRLAVAHCLEQAGAGLQDVELVAVGWDVPQASRLYGVDWRLEGTPEWLDRYLGWRCAWSEMPEVRFVGHHLAHASIAFHASDFDAAAVLVVDGNGDDESISIYRAERGRALVRTAVWPRSHSLGYLYEAACRFVGFGPLQAGKLMGLSAYGRAAGAEPWELLPGGEPAAPADVDDGDGFNRYIHAWGAQLDRLAGGRRVGHARDDLHRDGLAVQVAVSAQQAVESVVLRLAALARELAGTDNLCLAGGVALNCKANGLLSGPVFAPPAPHDAGTALGAAWHVAPPPAGAGRIAPSLGPVAGPSANGVLDGLHREPLSPERVCAALGDGAIGAIVQGAGEIGPRALGHRSIVADPSRPEMHRRLNTIKSREPWRPFGAAALRPRAPALWQPRPRLSDYMLAGTPVSDAGSERMPAAVHVDGTTRPQELDPASGGLLAELLTAWGDRAGGALINTSFNGPGEPIVSSVADAVACFRRPPA
jgi:carbamoyltransferase